MELCIYPKRTTSWKDFTQEMQMPHSIALDGYVPEGPRLNLQGPWANFNHHEEVSRLETRATCAQVLIALRMGLMQVFDPSHVSIHVNDCDEDVCLSVYLLRNYAQTGLHENYRLNRLVFMEDMLDTTGGAYTFPGDPMSLKQLLWVFEPYHVFRARGQLYTGRGFRNVIDFVGRRIQAHIDGDESYIEPDMDFEVVDRVNDLIMIREIGANARLGVYRSGVQYFISVRELRDGRFAYSLARSSQFVPFPIPKLLKVLNACELGVRISSNIRVDGSTGGWGGSDMIAGSPRDGSVLSPVSVMNILSTSR
ncbi:hypothetical protein BH11PAT2_BH11PAT2_04570 [soil metagenome]